MIFLFAESITKLSGGVVGDDKDRAKFISDSKEGIRVSIPKPGNAIMRHSDFRAYFPGCTNRAISDGAMTALKRII